MIDGQALRTLIVEDEGLVAVVIGRLVERLGHRVIGCAADGLQALRMCADLKPDIVLMDVDIPEIDGIEVSRRLTETSPVPVLLLTAHQTPELIDRASMAGVGAYLLKPPDLQDLERGIGITLARFADLADLRRLNAELRAALLERDEALARVRILEGILPICAYCKKIRDPQNSWHRIEEYITSHSEATFSHGICPDCRDTAFAELRPGRPTV